MVSPPCRQFGFSIQRIWEREESLKYRGKIRSFPTHLAVVISRLWDFSVFAIPRKAPVEVNAKKF